MTLRIKPVPRLRAKSRACALATTLLVAALGAGGCGGSSNSTSATNTRSSALGARTLATGHPTPRATKFSPALRAAYAHYAACMRREGISMPEPNLNDTGPVFDPRRVDTSNPRFASAIRTCRAKLLASTRSGGTGASKSG